MKEKFLRAAQIIMLGIIIGFIIITFGLGIYTLYTTANTIGKLL